MIPLTKRQHETLEFVGKYIEKKGYAPTYSEIADGIGVRSRSVARKHCLELEKKGRLHIKSRKFRALVIVEQR